MKIHLFILLFLLYGNNLFCQIEVKNFPFSIASDTKIGYKIDLVDNSFAETKGIHQQWSLKDMNSPLYREIMVKVNKSNQSYNIKSGNTTKNIKVSKNEMDETGITFVNTSNQIYRFDFNKPILISYLNLTYGARYFDNTSFSSTLMRNNLPSKLQVLIPQNIKQVKIIGELKRFYHCDAEGKFLLDYGNVSALRLHVNEICFVKLINVKNNAEIKFKNSEFLKSFFPDFSNKDYYLFFSNDFKYFFAKLFKIESSNDYQIEYQDYGYNNNGFDINGNSKLFVIFPNPSYGNLKIAFTNYQTGNYNLELLNIIGKKIWSKSIYVSGEMQMRFDFSNLRKGTYLINLKDKNGNLQNTKKLVIINV